jgi:hypothetical protein
MALNNQVIDLKHISGPIMAARKALIEAAGIDNWQELNNLEIREKLPLELIPVFDSMGNAIETSYHAAYKQLTE